MDQIKRQVRRTVQSQYRDEREVGMGVLFNMAIAGEIMPPWWSTQRDVELTRFTLRSDHFQGANWMISAKLCNVPFRVEARDRTVKRHQKIANEYQAILENVTQIGQGWGDFWSRFYADLWTTDNGGFGEILGMGSPGSARKGPAMGLVHLDSLRCTRTGNPEYPVYYQDIGGSRYRLHHTRVIYKSQRPSARADMNGVGHSWLTRAINNVQQLVDQDVYFQEALGSRPIRQMMLTKGIAPKDVIDAARRAEEGMDNQGLARYAKTLFVGDRNRTDIGIDTIPFTFLPEGYNKQEQTSIAMFVIALAGGFPPRWLWPATQAGATKADAMFQHISGSGGGALWHLNMMRDLLSYTDRALSIGAALPPKFLPKELRLVFDYKDDEEDRQQAEIKAVRANTRKTDLESGVTTVRVEREKALESGDITQAQFNQMELEGGRMPDGADVLTLFDSLDPLLIEMLDLGVDEPLAIDVNDPIEMMIAIEAAALAAQARMVQARSAGERAKAQQALEALGKLKAIYEEIVGKEIEEEIAAEQASGEFELPETTEAPPGEGESPETPEETPEDDEDAAELEKAFNYGARFGERIRGSLFRGRGGKFAGEAEVSAVKSEILARLIARLRAKRAGAGTGGGKGGKKKKPKKGGAGKKPKATPAQIARQKRAKQQGAMNDVFGIGGKLAEKMKMERNDIFALEKAVLDGEQVSVEDAQKFVELGLMELDSDGEPLVTSAGQALIKAAARGDIQGARRALERARKKVKPKDDEPKGDDSTGSSEEEKAVAEPPRGDFEQEIIRKLKPVFRKAQVQTLTALQRGVEPDDEELRKELIALFVPILTSAALYKVNLFENQFTIAFDAGETQAEAERWARIHAATLTAGLITTTQNIVNGIEPDSTQDEIESTVDRAFDENRREQIGITETTVALMFGAMMYQRLVAGRGVAIELIWYTREDERVCPICAPLNRKKQEVWSQQFPDGAPAHVRCRCDVIARRKR